MLPIRGVKKVAGVARAAIRDGEARFPSFSFEDFEDPLGVVAFTPYQNGNIVPSGGDRHCQWICGFNGRDAGTDRIGWRVRDSASCNDRKKVSGSGGPKCPLTAPCRFKTEMAQRVQ